MWPGFGLTARAFGGSVRSAFTGGSGRAIQGAAIGGIAGAGWGMMSGDTSVLGGAMMGAGLGAGGMRYGGRAMDIGKLARSSGMGRGRSGILGTMGAGRLMARDARLGYRYARMRTSRAANTIRGMAGLGLFGGGLA